MEQFWGCCWLTQHSLASAVQQSLGVGNGAAEHEPGVMVVDWGAARLWGATVPVILAGSLQPLQAAEPASARSSEALGPGGGGGGGGGECGERGSASQKGGEGGFEEGAGAANAGQSKYNTSS